MLKKFLSSLIAVVLLLAVVPIQSFASENENVQEDIFESDFINFEDFTDTLSYEESFAIYQEKIAETPEISQVQPYFLLRLLFSLVKSGTNYVLKITSKGKTIKSVRNGKLEVDLKTHINAKDRFSKANYGNLDTLVKYIVEDIRRMDAAGFVKNGDNTIRTVYGKDQKLLEIRFHVQKGELLQFNALPDHSRRDLGNVVYLVPQ